MRLRALFPFIVLLVWMTSCKKQQWKGVYAGTEELTIKDSTDTISSTFQQTATVSFKGSKCNYSSSTIIWEFERNEKMTTGYSSDGGPSFFQISFEEDSVLTEFFTEESDQIISRIFKGKK